MTERSTSNTHSKSSKIMRLIFVFIQHSGKEMRKKLKNQTKLKSENR